MGNEALKPKTPVRNNSLDTNFYTLPRRKKQSKLNCDRTTNSAEPRVTHTNFKEIHQNNSNDITKNPDPIFQELRRLKDEMMSKDLELSRLNKFIRDANLNTGSPSKSEIKAKLDVMNKKYLESKFRYFVLKEEKSDLEDQIEAQEYELEGIQQAYFSMLGSQRRKANRDNKTILSLKRENEKLRKQLRLKAALIQSRERQHKRLKQSFSIIKDALNSLVIIEKDQTLKHQKNYLSDRNILNASERENRNSSMSSKLKNKDRHKTDRHWRKTYQFEILLQGTKKENSFKIKLSGVLMNLSVTQIDDQILKITLRLRNKVVKQFEMLKDRYQESTKQSRVIQSVLKDYTALRAYSCNLRMMCIRHKKIIERFDKRCQRQQSFTGHHLAHCAELNANEITSDSNANISQENTFNDENLSTTRLSSNTYYKLLEEKLCDLKLRVDTLRNLSVDVINNCEESVNRETNLHSALTSKNDEINSLKRRITILENKLNEFTEAMNFDTPKGWCKKWASWSGEFYYLNIHTNQAQWERP